ncbi:MAG: S41 family peptidase [Elusimicrobia bacterium]|nr:S41 family peptidase [Elusimicrobiota bacterium]
MKNFFKRKYLAVIVVAILAGFSFKLAYSAAGVTYQQLKILVDVINYVLQEYVEEIEPKKLIYGAARGIVDELDIVSEFMEPQAKEELLTESEGEYGGIGIRMVSSEKFITIIAPIPATPAYRAGLLPGDKIVKIDDESTKGMSVDKALKKMRGEPGGKVKLTIAREPEDKNSTAGVTFHEYTIVREMIKFQSVFPRMLQDGIGYVWLIDFNAKSDSDLANALAELKNKGMKALIFDLRYNTGGLFLEAVKIAKFFIGDNKTIVSLKGRKTDMEEFKSGAKAPYADIPIAMLVNGGSASSSEILAGALQDNKRAVLLGSRTFGKASVQTVFPLDDNCGLKLTVAKYYTPSGKSIQRDYGKSNTGGIQPDIEVNLSRENELKLIKYLNKVYNGGKEQDEQLKKDEEYKDEALEMAVGILKARESFKNLSADK